jgi:hypothetical protein
MPSRSSSGRFRAPRLRPGLSFAQAIERMKTGKVLRFAFDRSRPAWTIGDESISAEIVSLLLSCREIEADVDTLFPNTPAQSWRIRSVE